jgi:iron-sulfur cluster assembly accessory protein
MLTLSPKAAGRILDLLRAEGKSPEAFGLRVAVEGGGCSGFQYRMEIGQASPGDNVYEHEGARVIVDPKSLLFIGGSIVDYSDGLTAAGFTVRNPNATGTCGCGTSFSV